MAMQQTRWAILQFLKRQGTGSVEELAHHLSLAPMTVRQHLAILERDGLIGYREVRSGPGRPSHRYILSQEGEDLFPKAYDKLAERLLQELALLPEEEICGLTGRDRLGRLMERMAERVAGEYERDVRGETPEERIQAVVDVLRRREGTLSEWTWAGGAFHIEDVNCPFQRIATARPELCAWHLHLLSRMLRSDVYMESCMTAGESCCRYRVEFPASQPAAPPSGSLRTSSV